MTTNRVPLARPANTRITARALELFALTEKARRRRRAAACVANEYGLCAPCRAWADAHNELHIELRLKPWQWPCLPINPFPPGSARAKGWEPSGPELALWQTLERARRAALAAPARRPAVSAFGQTGH
jgi:hypothetical protein